MEDTAGRSGIQCTYCQKIHADTCVSKNSEATLFQVMDSTHAHPYGKQYFCSPICYIAHRQGRVRPTWKSLEKWYATDPERWPPEAVARQFLAFKEVLRIDSNYSLEDARAGRE